MNKFMRLIVFFDLPVKTKEQQRAATHFRSFLQKDGFYLIQYSVYGRVCNGQDDVAKHQKRIESNIPNNGSIRLLTITEKQYESISILLGDYRKEEKFKPTEQLTIF